jgi:alpha-tubulin suppressor-like RCC1 family protein
MKQGVLVLASVALAVLLAAGVVGAEPIAVDDQEDSEQVVAAVVEASEPAGRVWAWGANYAGQLGNGTTTDFRDTPVKVDRLDDSVVDVSAGDGHSLALNDDGTVWAWGENDFGQLGIGASGNRRTPVEVPGLRDIVDVEAGSDHSLALNDDGTVWAWGNNTDGQLGDGTTTNRRKPVKVVGLDGVVDVSGGGGEGGVGYNSHSLAVKRNGTVWAWGDNSEGQLGDGTNKNRRRPVKAVRLDSVVKVDAGVNHSVALKNNGRVRAWGRGQAGQLGVDGLRGIVDVSAGGNHSLALKRDGTVWRNSFRIRGFNNVVDVEAGFFTSLYVKRDGTVWYGPSSRIRGLKNVVDVSRGYGHGLAISTPPER